MGHHKLQIVLKHHDFELSIPFISSNRRCISVSFAKMLDSVDSSRKYWMEWSVLWAIFSSTTSGGSMRPDSYAEMDLSLTPTASASLSCVILLIFRASLILLPKSLIGNIPVDNRYLTILELSITKMDKILLLVTDPKLRQLYHELLNSENIEILAVSSVENAIAMFAFNTFRAVVVYPDDIEQPLVETFFHLLHKIDTVSRSRVIVLTSDPDLYSPLFGKRDIAINIIHLNPDEIIVKIQKALSL